MQNGVVWWSNANCIWWIPCAPVVLVQHPWELLLPFVSLSLCLCLYSTWLEFVHPIPVLRDEFYLCYSQEVMGWVGLDSEWGSVFHRFFHPSLCCLQHRYTCVSVFCVGFEDNVHCLWNFLLCEIFMHYCCCIVLLAVQNLLSVFKSSTTAVTCVTWREMMWVLREP